MSIDGPFRRTRRRESRSFASLRSPTVETNGSRSTFPARPCVKRMSTGTPPRAVSWTTVQKGDSTVTNCAWRRTRSDSGGTYGIDQPRPTTPGEREATDGREDHTRRRLRDGDELTFVRPADVVPSRLAAGVEIQVAHVKLVLSADGRIDVGQREHVVHVQVDRVQVGASPGAVIHQETVRVEAGGNEEPVRRHQRRAEADRAGLEEHLPRPSRVPETEARRVGRGAVERVDAQAQLDRTPRRTRT